MKRSLPRRSSSDSAVSRAPDSFDFEGDLQEGTATGQGTDTVNGTNVIASGPGDDTLLGDGGAASDDCVSIESATNCEGGPEAESRSVAVLSMWSAGGLRLLLN